MLCIDVSSVEIHRKRERSVLYNSIVVRVSRFVCVMSVIKIRREFNQGCYHVAVNIDTTYPTCFDLRLQ